MFQGFRSNRKNRNYHSNRARRNLPMAAEKNYRTNSNASSNSARSPAPQAPGRTTAPSNNLLDVYISNFSSRMQQMTDGELRELLEGIAGVKCVRFTNKGAFCFFQVRGEQNFQKALGSLKNADVQGTMLSAQPSSGRRGCTTKQTKLSESLHNLAKQNNITPILEPRQFYLLERASRTLYVGNVPQEANEKDVQACFDEYGPIEKTVLIESNGGAAHVGYGFVFFINHADAESAVEANKAILLREQQLAIQTSRPSNPIISIAHQAGLIDMDSNPTTLLVDLLTAAKADVSSKLGSFSRQQSVFVQNPMTGIVYSMMQDTLAAYTNELMTGRLIQVPSPLTTAYSHGLTQVGRFPTQAPALQSPVPTLTMPHLANGSYSFPHGYGYPQNQMYTNAYSCYPPQNTPLMSPQPVALMQAPAPQPLIAPQNSRNCSEKRKREEPFEQVQENALNAPSNDRKRRKTPAAAGPSSPSPPQQNVKMTFKSKAEPKRAGSHIFKLNFKNAPRRNTSARQVNAY